MSFDISQILIYPNSKEEEKYCKKYNIELERLENGITILGLSCKKDFSASAHIKYEFSEGAWKNQAGSIHFLEHFINKRARPIALRNLLEIRAWTSYLEIGEELSGIANTQIRDFGIWTVLDEIRKSLESPLSTVDDLQKTIETEKDVIKAEFKKQETNHEFQVYKHFVEKFYSPENPLYIDPPVVGNEEDIDKLTLETLKKAQDKILISNNLLISFYTEGDLEISKSLTKELKNLFLKFPTGKKNKLDRKLLDKINDIKAGEIYSKDPNLKNAMITTEFIWKFDHAFPSTKHFGLNILKSEIKNELFAHSRKMGWGYFTEVYLTRPSDNISFVRLRVDTRKDSKKDLTNGIKEILSKLKNNTQSLIEIENKRQLATPMNVTSRLSWAVDGIKEHEAIIDGDKIRQIMLEVKAQDLNDLIDEMISTNPITLITGDLS